MPRTRRPSAAPTPPDRRKARSDRRAVADRRELPPRPEGRRMSGGRRKRDPIDP